jgi:hypothetical protein
MVALLDGGLQACRTVNFIKPGYVPLRFVWRGTRAINLRASQIGTPFNALTHLEGPGREKKKNERGLATRRMRREIRMREQWRSPLYFCIYLGL